MRKKIMPFLIIGLCMAAVNIILITRYGQLSDWQFIVMLAVNIIGTFGNIMAAVKILKSQNK